MAAEALSIGTQLVYFAKIFYCKVCVREKKGLEARCVPDIES
jgi:hypothetical protein